jgi:hypothetical protein
MPSVLFVAFAIVSWSQMVVPPPAPAPVPALEIAVRTLRVDGTESGRASNDGVDRFSGYLSVGDSLCSVAANSRDAAADDLRGTGWQVSGQIVRQTGDDFIVKVDWLRAWEHGERVQNGPRGSIEITMRLGDQFPLDSVVPFRASECGVAVARLEAAMVTRQPWQLRGGGGGFSGAGRAGAGAGQVSAGGGRRTEVAAPGGSAGSGSQNSGIAPMTSEMWLVHRRPDGTEEALRQVISTSGAAAPFNFAPISVPTSRGRVAVTLTGTLQLVQPGASVGKEGSVVASSAPQLRIAMDRQVTVEGAPPGGSRGRSMMELALPKASEVIAFELPPLRNSERDVFEGHQFSLRLRVTAAK